MILIAALIHNFIFGYLKMYTHDEVASSISSSICLKIALAPQGLTCPIIGGYKRKIYLFCFLRFSC